jgi:hypothetical protein
MQLLSGGRSKNYANSGMYDKRLIPEQLNFKQLYLNIYLKISTKIYWQLWILLHWH